MTHEEYLVSVIEQLEELFQRIILHQESPTKLSWEIHPLLVELDGIGMRDDEDAMYFSYLVSETDHLIPMENIRHDEIKESDVFEKDTARNAAISLLDKIKKKKLTLIDAFSNA